ncbi:MAG: hypothetical protein B1H13_06775 [Desulfobacteraceae bacterium 4484_190.3]|nr:MAG: hypothetical protein B1H13_06775 [Desulfobacteraceae bacterium 4484_190.3]
MEQYIHQELEKEVKSISGSYTLVEEEHLIYRGREVLYVVGFAMVDSSCCGVGGCRFINIPGYVVSWKREKDVSGLPVSEIEPITEEEEQKEIKKLLEFKYPHSQIHFQSHGNLF